MAGIYRIDDLLTLLRREGAEKLHLASDAPQTVVIRGKPHPLDTPSLSPEELDILLNSISNEQQRKELEPCGDVRFIFAHS